jgi:hypothetical protein
MTRVHLLVLCTALFSVAAMVPRSASADDPPAGEDLLKGLESDLLDDLPADLSDAIPGGDSGIDGDLEKQLGEDVRPGDDENPLAQIGDRMRDAEERIARGAVDDETQQLQQKIVADIETLIEEIKKQQKQQQQSSSGQKGSSRSQVRQPGSRPAGANAKRPARDSTDRIGRAEAEAIDMAAMKEQLKDLWGHLPEREREQMVQWSADSFLPKYDIMIRKYFLRLAEQGQE